jgi:hypothetical protein
MVPKQGPDCTLFAPGPPRMFEPTLAFFYLWSLEGIPHHSAFVGLLIGSAEKNEGQGGDFVYG